MTRIIIQPVDPGVGVERGHGLAQHGLLLGQPPAPGPGHVVLLHLQLQLPAVPVCPQHSAPVHPLNVHNPHPARRYVFWLQLG